MTPSEQIALIGAAESDTLEWKATLDHVAIANAICAFLNDKGGRIVVGVDNSGQLTGLQITDQELTSVESKLRLAITPSGSWSVVREELDGKTLLLIDVSAGSQGPYLVKGTIWTRRGSMTTPATAKDIDKFISHRVRQDERWERRTAIGLGLEDLDEDEVYKAIADIERRGHYRFQQRDNLEHALQELSLSFDGRLSNAAAILFARNPASRYPQASVRLFGYPTDKTGVKISFSEESRSHLFGSLKKIESTLQDRVSVSSDFEPGKVRRTDRAEYPFGALREGVMNALVHRNFENSSGGMTISFFSNRVEIWNAGELPSGLTPSGLKKDHPSLPRNPDIAHVCFLRGLIERVGRGTQLIAKECAAAGLKPPQWSSDSIGTKLTIFGRRGGMASPSDLNRRQQLILKKVKARQQITVAEVLDLLQPEEVTDRTVRTDLAGLVRGGYLIQTGKGRSTLYKRTDAPAP